MLRDIIIKGGYISAFCSIVICTVSCFSAVIFGINYLFRQNGGCDSHDYICPPDNSTNANYTHKIQVITGENCYTTGNTAWSPGHQQCYNTYDYVCQNPNPPLENTSGYLASIVAKRITTTSQQCVDSGNASGIVALSLFGLALIALILISCGFLLTRLKNCSYPTPRRMQSPTYDDSESSTMPPIDCNRYPNLQGLVPSRASIPVITPLPLYTGFGNHGQFVHSSPNAQDVQMPVYNNGSW